RHAVILTLGLHDRLPCATEVALSGPMERPTALPTMSTSTSSFVADRPGRVVRPNAMCAVQDPCSPTSPPMRVRALRSRRPPERFAYPLADSLFLDGLGSRSMRVPPARR